MDEKMQTILAALIDGVPVSIISSVDDQGFPNTKAMLPPRKRSGIREFWFTTNTASQRVSQYSENPKASLYFFDDRSFQGVMLVGWMTVLHDLETKREIWRPGDERYYAQGLSDPDYCILKFSTVRGRYYHRFRSIDFTVCVDDVPDDHTRDGQ